jgi:hypothetical protein
MGFHVDLVMPVVYECYWELAKNVIDGVLSSYPSTEVVLNDIGLLRHAGREWRGHVSVGRLFNRMKRDQFALAGSEVHPSIRDGYCANSSVSGNPNAEPTLLERQRACYGYPYLREEAYCQLLRAAKVERIAWDVLPTTLNASLPEAFESTLYAPWTYSTSSRACATAIAMEGSASSYPTRKCSRPCDRSTILPEYPWLQGQVVQRGTATFLDMKDHLEAFAASMKPVPSRLVFQPLVPY